MATTPTSYLSPYLDAKLAKKLNQLRQQINQLSLPTSSFLGVYQAKHQITLAEIGGAQKSFIHHQSLKKQNNQQSILKWIAKHTRSHHIKFIGLAINPQAKFNNLNTKLWLDLDIVPLQLKSRKKTLQDKAVDLAHQAASKFRHDNSAKPLLTPANKVKVSQLVNLASYAQTTSQSDFNRLKQLASDCRHCQLLFFNSTPQGGGVAIMRHALIRLFNLLKVKASWFVMHSNKDIFDITKTKIHNVLQAVAPKKLMLSPEDQKLFATWSKENAQRFEKPIKTANIIVIDDPQPSGLIPFIKQLNPKAKIIYRSHIQVETELIKKPGTPQNKTWNFLWQNIKHADLFISQPIARFTPHTVERKKIGLMPATTDSLDGLNKPLTPQQMDYYLKLFNKLLLETAQQPLDLSRPYFIQVARFDPSKGIPDLIEAFSLLYSSVKKSLPKPQLVIVGNGSIDDPDGFPIYVLTQQILQQDKYKKLARDIKVALLPHIDQLLNSLLSKSHAALQLSIKEGFEVKVTEALMKGKPVIANNTGGIPLQINPNVNGFLVKPGDTQTVAHYMHQLLFNQNLYQQMSQAAQNQKNPDVTTVSNATNWLFIAKKLLQDKTFTPNGSYIKNLIT